MSNVPRPPNSLGDCLRWCRDTYDYLTSREEIPSPNTLLTRTTRGTGRSAIGGDGGGADDGHQIGEIRQWDVATDYLKDELAFCDSVSERNDGTQAGLYQALEDVTGGSHPSVSASWILVARWHWDLLTFRNGTGKIEIDVTAANPVIRMYKDYNDVNAGAIVLDTAGIGGAIPSGYNVVALRDDTFCVGPNLKNIIWLASLPRDP